MNKSGKPTWKKPGQGGSVLLPLLVFVSASICPLKAQFNDLHFNHLTIGSGLSQSINAYVFRDSKGFVWLSSTDGLNRFDGISVTNYRPKAGEAHTMLGSNIQSPFFEDDEGDLWFGTNKALHCYRRATNDFQYYGCLDSSGQTRIESHHVFYRQQHYLWLRAGIGCYQVDWYQLKRGVAMAKASRQIGKLPDVGQLRCFVQPAAQNCFDVFSTCYGVIPGVVKYHFDGNALQETAHWEFQDDESNATNWLLPDQGDTLWLATAKGLGLFLYNSGKLTFPNAGNLRIETYVRTVVPWGNRYLFVSTKNGLYLFDKWTGRAIKNYQHQTEDVSSLAKDFTDELYIDETGTLWVSQWMFGVDYANLYKTKFKKISLKTQEKEKPATVFVPKSMCEDLDGRIWIGSNMHGLQVTDRQFQPLNIPPPGKVNIEKVYCAPNGDVWLLPHRSAPLIFERGAKKYTDTKIAGDQARSFMMVQTMHSGQIWLQDKLSQGIFEAEKKQGVWEIAPLDTSILPFNRYGIFFEDSDHQLWIAENGTTISRFQSNQGRYKRARSFINNGQVLAYVETRDHVWAAGKFGLLRMPKAASEKERLFSAADGLPNETVYAVLPDKKGGLWLSTNHGIVQFDIESQSFKTFSLADGLQDLEFNEQCYLQLADGHMLMGGVKGLNLFHPDSVKSIETLPRVALLGLRVNDEPYELKKNICELDSLKLKYYQNTLSVEFSSLEFSDPAGNRLQYRMMHADGAPYDDSWVQCKNAEGFARYANLPFGKYVLLIKAANSDGVWNEQHPRKLFIQITPPFWRTWWFYSLCALLLAGVTYFSIRIYVQNKLRLKNLQLREQRIAIEKQEALTQERNRIAAEMHDDFGTGLTAIQRISERAALNANSPEARKAIENITSYSLELIGNMREIIWAMSGKNDTLENLMAYISENAYRYLGNHNIEVDIVQPEEIPDLEISGERRRNIYLAVKESLHNVVKHAQASAVSIHFQLNGMLEIHVRDNGKGFENKNLKGYGMGNMAKRMEDIGGKMSIENNGGAHLKFSIPIEKLKPR